MLEVIGDAVTLFLSTVIILALSVGTLGALIYSPETGKDESPSKEELTETEGEEEEMSSQDSRIAAVNIENLVRVLLNDKEAALSIAAAVSKGPLPPETTIGAVNFGTKEAPDWHDLSFMFKEKFYRSKLGGFLLNLRKKTQRNSQKNELSNMLEQNPRVTEDIKKFIATEHQFPEFQEE